MGKKTPDTPDVVGAANKEGEFNRQAARDQTYADRPDQYNAMGSSTWQQENVIDPATGESTTKWTQRENLSDGMQNLYDQSMNANTALGNTAGSMVGRVNDAAAQPYNWDQYGDIMAGPSASGPVGGGVDPTTGQDTTFSAANQNGPIGAGVGPTTTGSSRFGGASSAAIGADLAGTTGGGEFAWDSANRGRAEDASYARSASRLNPQWQQRDAAFDRKMANRGIRAGDSAFDSASGNYGRDRNDAYEMARLGSVEQGRIEDQQSYGQAKGAWDSNRAAEAQRFDQAERANQNAREADQQRYMQQYGQFNANLGAEQQQFSQGLSAGENDRAAEDQRYGQATGDYSTNLAGEQQAFTQAIDTGTNNRAADQQSFNQGMDSNARANALRTQSIDEGLAKRNMPLTDYERMQNAQAQGVNNMTQNFSSGG